MIEVILQPMPRGEYERLSAQLQSLQHTASSAYKRANVWWRTCQICVFIAVVAFILAGIIGIGCTLFSLPELLPTGLSLCSATFAVANVLGLLTGVVASTLERPARLVSAETIRLSDRLFDHYPSDD